MQTMVRVQARWAHKVLGACALSSSLIGGLSQAATFCVFDPTGAVGTYSLSLDYAISMQRDGVMVESRLYSNEAKAVDDFKAGVCDAVMATAFRTRQFNPIAASTDTLGATTVVRNGRIDIADSYEVLRKVVQTYSTPSPQAQRLMVNGAYEIGGIMPVGVAYPIVRDRAINSVEALAGKRIASLDHDPAQAIMIRRVGAVPVSSDVPNIASRLGTGAVDLIAAPAIGFKALGIDRAMGDKGAVIRFPLMILTFQMVINRSKFPEGFGEKSRAYWQTQFDRSLQLVKKVEQDIPSALWMELSTENAYRYTLILREARMDIAQSGIYDKRGLKILKRIRCHVNPTDPECKTRSEEDWVKPAGP